jgi:hypothetical protein
MNWPISIGLIALLLVLAALKLGRFVFVIMLIALVLFIVAGLGLLGRKRPRK